MFSCARSSFVSVRVVTPARMIASAGKATAMRAACSGRVIIQATRVQTALCYPLRQDERKLMQKEGGSPAAKL